MDVGVRISGEYDKDLAIVVQSEAQYYAIEPLLVALKENKKYTYDIFVNPLSWDSSGHQDIAKATVRLLKAKGFGVTFSKTSQYSYKVILAAYADLIDVRYKYIIQYLYAVISAKPDPVYRPEFMRYFHGVLCHSTYEQDLLSVYAQTYLVSSLKYDRGSEYNRHEQTDKTILFLASYDSDISDTLQMLKRAKSRGFKIAIKLHHGTQYLYSERAKRDDVRRVADKIFNSSASLKDLFATATVVVCGNTGAIFEAMYAGVPVLLAGDDFNQHKIGNLDTLQYKLLEEGILHSIKNESKDIDLLEDKALQEMAKKQHIYSDSIFKADTGIDGWYEVIDSYLEDRTNQDYVALHDYYISEVKDRRFIESELKADSYSATVPVDSLKSKIKGLFSRD